MNLDRQINAGTTTFNPASQTVRAGCLAGINPNPRRIPVASESLLENIRFLM
jgi:hypothetical protein